LNSQLPLAGPPRLGCLFVIAAPSGAGKTSLVRALLANHAGLKVSVSSTTRPARPGEVNGVDYTFLSESEFLQKKDAGEFIEWAKVHGNYYGTSRHWIASETSRGVDIVLEIDWQGAQQIKQLFPQAVGIFIAPPSIEDLKQRLIDRGQDSEAVIEGRLNAAQGELNHAHDFEYVIINQHFSDALADLTHIVLAARLRYSQQSARFPELLTPS
jgi:guanylate kinase